MDLTQNPVLSASQALLAIAIITAIPVILFALWGEYFKKYLEEAQQLPDPLDRMSELQRLRSASLFGLMIQIGLFFSTFTIRKEAHSPWSTFFPIFAISVQTWIQVSLEKTLFRITQKNGTPLPSSSFEKNQKTSLNTTPLKAFAWSMVAASVYLGFLGGLLTFGLLATQWFKFNALWTGAALLAVTTFGVLGGLWLNFGLAPFYIKQVFKTQPLSDEHFLSEIKALAGPDSLDVRILFQNSDRSEAPQIATAMLAGMPRAQRFFGTRFTPTIFLTEALIQTLSKEEQKSVIAHEIAHLKLKHLRKKVVFSTSVIIGVSFVATFLVFLAHLILQNSSVHLIGLCSGLGAFFVAFKLLSEKSKEQELEADLYAIQHYKISLDSWASALRKIEQSPMGQRTSITHPPTDRRIELVRLEVERSMKELLESEQKTNPSNLKSGRGDAA